MNDQDLQLVLAAFKRRHPDAVQHLRALTAAQGTPVADAATPILMLVLQLFDDLEQTRWTMRDMLGLRQRNPADPNDARKYAFLKYGASEMVYRLAVCAGLPLEHTTYFNREQPPEIANWKSDHE